MVQQNLCIAQPAATEPSDNHAHFEHVCRTLSSLAAATRNSRLADLRFSVLKNPDVTKAGLAVLEAVINRINWKMGFWYPSVGQLASDTGLSKRTIFRSLSKLEDIGVLQRQHSFDLQTGRQMNSKITLPGLVRVAKAKEGEGDTDGTGRVTIIVRGEGDTCCHPNKETSEYKTSELKEIPPSPRKRGRRDRYDFLGLVEEIGAKSERDRIIATALRQMAHLVPSFHGDACVKRAHVEKLAKVAGSARKKRLGKYGDLEDLGLPSNEELSAVFEGQPFEDFVNLYEKSSGERRIVKHPRVLMPAADEFKRFIERQLKDNELARELRLRDERRVAEEAHERLRADEIAELVSNALSAIKRGKDWEEAKLLQQVYDNCPSDLRAIVFRRLHSETSSWTLLNMCDDWRIELGSWR